MSKIIHNSLLPGSVSLISASTRAWVTRERDALMLQPKEELTKCCTIWSQAVHFLQSQHTTITKHQTRRLLTAMTHWCSLKVKRSGLTAACDWCDAVVWDSTLACIEDDGLLSGWSVIKGPWIIKTQQTLTAVHGQVLIDVQIYSWKYFFIQKLHENEQRLTGFQTKHTDQFSYSCNNVNL